MNSLDQKTIDELHQVALNALSHSYSPYSKCQVGSAVLGESGRIYPGTNVENSSYGITDCAERAAVIHAITAGERKLTAVLVVSKDGWPPCGSCRQVLAEFAAPTTPVLISNKKEIVSTKTLGDLLPLAYTPDHVFRAQK